MVADDEFEEIPFQLAIDTSSSQGNTTTPIFQWRPDPALYLAVLAGQFEVTVENTIIEGSGTLDLLISYTVAGWKSIMGNPDKKRRSRRPSKKTTTKKA